MWKLDLPDRHFDGVFANAALFHVPGQELPRVLLELYASHLAFSSARLAHVTSLGWQAIPMFEQLKFSPD